MKRDLGIFGPPKEFRLAGICTVWLLNLVILGARGMKFRLFWWFGGYLRAFWAQGLILGAFPGETVVHFGLPLGIIFGVCVEFECVFVCVFLRRFWVGF